MTRILLLLACLTLLASPLPARAQEAPTLAELEIDFWPEYDQRAMLVIYRGTLAADTPLPASLTFAIPAEYGPPLAVAFTDSQGQLLNLEYTTTTVGDRLLIAFDAPTRKFQFEYYDASLDLSAPTRRYAFSGAVTYPVQTLLLKVQQPTGASQMAAQPALDQQALAEDGLMYFSGARANLAANEAISLELSYTKNDDTLSINSPRPLVATPQLPSAAAPTPLANTTTLIAVAAAIVGVLLVGGGVALFIRTRNEQTESAGDVPHARRRTKRPRKTAPTPPASSPADTGQGQAARAAFCHECGQPIQADDLFCRHCGTKVRR